MKNQAGRFFVLALLALTIYLLFLVFEPFLSSIAWAIFFSTAFYPVYSFLLRWMKKYDWLASILTTTLIATIIIVPGIFMISTLADTLTPWFSGLEEKLGSIGSEQSSLSVGLSKLQSYLDPYIQVSQGKLREVMTASITRIARALSEQIQPLIQNAMKTLLGFFVMIFTMTVLFRQGPVLIQACRRLLPLTEEDKEAVFLRLHEVTRAIFYGVLMTALIQAILGTVGWVITGLPNALFFGIAMFFSALIPILGTTLIWVPGVIYLYLHDATGKAVFLALWGALVVSAIDNFLKPIFISGRTRLHMLIVFFGIFGGMTAFGLKGIFVGPLVITLFLFLGEVVRRDLFPLSDSPKI